MAVTWDGYGSMGTGTFQTWLTLSTRKEGWAEEHLKAALVTLGDLHLPCLTHWGLFGFWSTAERSQSVASCGLVTLDMEKVAASGAEHQAEAGGQAGSLPFLSQSYGSQCR